MLDPYGDGPLALKLWRGGEYRTLEFSGEDLLQVEGDPEVQRRLGERMRAVLPGPQAGAPLVSPRPDR